MKKIFAKLNEHLPDNVPYSSGPNVFTSTEYAKEMGFGLTTASKRLNKLLEQGHVRRVRVKHQNYAVLAYEYVGKG